MAYQVTYEEDGTPVLRDQDGARIRYQDLTGSGIGMDDGQVILPSNVTADTINDPTALTSSWAAQNPALWDQLAGNTFGGKVGGTAGLVAPGYMNPASMTGGLYDPNILFSDYSNDVYGVDVSGLRKSGYTPEEMAAREAFLAAHPGYGQVTASQMSDNGAFKGAGPSAGNFIVDASKVQYDPTYGYITPTSNFGYAGGKGGHGEAVRSLAAMAAAAFGASYFGPGAAGVGEAAGAGGGAGVFGGDFAGTAGLFETGANGLVSTSGALSGGAGAAGGFSGGAGGGGAIADGGFVGGASGGGLAGGGLGGTLSGLNTSELAAMGIGGSGAGSAFGGLGDFVSSIFAPSGGQATGASTAGQLGGALLNYFGNKSAADDLSAAGMSAASMSNPLNDPKRFGYQQDLYNLLSNPGAFYDTNPVVKAQMDLAKNQFLANSAKMGVGGTQFNNYLQNVQNNAAGTFNTQADLLAQLGGYKSNSGNSGSSYLAGAQGAASANKDALQGFANIFGGMAGNSGGGNQFDLSKLFSGAINSLG